MNTTNKAVLIGLTLLLAGGIILLQADSSIAAEANQLAGDWEGNVDFKTSQPEVKLSLKHDVTKGMTGRVILPGQKMDFEVENFKLEGDKVKFDISNDRTSACFEGTFNHQSRCIEGEFKQAGQSHPFMLQSRWSGSVEME